MLRIALLSFRGDVFEALHTACVRSGHTPVVAIHERAHGKWSASYPDTGYMVTDILSGLPSEMDLLLPGTADGLAQALRGYRTDLLVVCGCSWRLPRLVLDAPRLGVLNVHPSLLPRYRGPAPLEWAIRNGDPDVGVTVHWMNEKIDSGNIVVQRGGTPLEEYPTYDSLWRQLAPVVGELVVEALKRVVDGFAGESQDSELATGAGVMEPEYAYVDWSWSAQDVHNQVRTFHYATGTLGPIASVDGEWVRIVRTRLTSGPGIRIECGDGPIWVVDTKPVKE